jgi:hypothetical protein
MAPSVTTINETAESASQFAKLMTRSVFEVVDWPGFLRYKLIKSKEGPI